MTFLSALILGLLASAHCSAMCGGLQSALQQSVVIRSPQQASQHLVALNAGRLTIYLLAGFLFSLFGSVLITIADIPQLIKATRYITAFIILLVGIQLLFSNQRPFRFLETLGADLWHHASKLLPQKDTNKLSHSFARGLIWGFIPCGVIYSVLLTTFFSNNTAQSIYVMLGFGLGTLPAMIITGGFYIQIRKLMHNKALRLFGAAIFIQGGLLMILAPWLVNNGFMANYPQLMSTLFCVS